MRYTEEMTELRAAAALTGSFVASSYIATRGCTHIEAEVRFVVGSSTGMELDIEGNNVPSGSAGAICEDNAAGTGFQKIVRTLPATSGLYRFPLVAFAREIRLRARALTTSGGTNCRIRVARVFARG